MSRQAGPASAAGARRGGRGERPVLITGGAGFVGTNLASRLLSHGQRVTVFDNLSRPGADRNLRWLRDTYGGLLRIEIGDVRDRKAVQRVVQGSRQVYHFAAQVAVTTSLLDPLHDFEVNARGTLNLLSAVNSLDDPPPLLFTSTNKVYGSLADVRLVRTGGGYCPVDETLRAGGIGESRPLDFHSPYGCSKGAADQYVLDYARTFEIPAAVFRMSCVYGPHQHGNEDQGWVGHFLIQALLDETITLYGDGKQVRDLLFAEDLVDALLVAQDRMAEISGRAFNIGGGAGNATSLIEVLEHVERLTGRRPKVEFGEWRPGDQRYYVSDTSAFSAATGWVPRVTVAAGLARLYEWLVTEAKVTERRGRVRSSSGDPATTLAAAAVGS